MRATQKKYWKSATRKPFEMKLIKIYDSEGKEIFKFDEDKVIWGGADFSGVDLEKANLQGVIWQEVKLCRANLKNADFYWANLFMSDLSETNCENAVFSGTNLEETNFSRANLRKTVFCKDKFGGANELEGANFSKTNLNEAIFEPESATYDEMTIFPDNFNPEEKKLRFVKKK